MEPGLKEPEDFAAAPLHPVTARIVGGHHDPWGQGIHIRPKPSSYRNGGLLPMIIQYVCVPAFSESDECLSISIPFRST
jgi:hypothetical protein